MGHLWRRKMPKESKLGKKGVKSLLDRLTLKFLYSPKK